MYTNFNFLPNLTVQKYQRYLPTAFSDDLTMLEKVNKLIEFCKQTGITVEQVITDWNEVMEWVQNEGLESAVIEQLNVMLNDGTFETIINEQLLNSKASIILDNVQPTNPNGQTYWFEVVG